MPDDKGYRTVGVSDMPRTIKGYQWFEQVAGRSVTIEGVSLLGNNKGATRYGALVVCKSRDHAKDFARRVKDKNEGPRAKVLNNDKDAEEFRAEMVKNKGWSTDAPDGDRAITSATGLDIRGDATGFSHGFNPYKRSPSNPPRRSPSPPRRRRSPSSPKRRRSRSASRKQPQGTSSRAASGSRGTRRRSPSGRKNRGGTSRRERSTSSGSSRSRS